MNIAIIFAGGRGQRLNGSMDSVPKQFLEINKKPILIHTLQRFQEHKEIDKIYIAVLLDYIEYTENLVKTYHLDKVERIVIGGETAQDSIYNALKAAEQENPKDSIVLIHDGVRPVLTSRVISDNIKSVKENGTAITVVPCYETILISPDGKKPTEVPLRKDTYAAQAPQSFRLEEILEAHKKIREVNGGYDNMVDSCTIYHTLGKETHLVKGNFGNIKITTPQDVYILEGVLKFLEENELSEKDK